MINAYSLPQIFYTMTMAEDKWPQLGTILESTDNNDTLPTNRPLHVYMFYRNYLNLIRANMPNPHTEPDLHYLVTTFQIHHCDHRCGGQGPNGEPCSKGFSQPLS